MDIRVTNDLMEDKELALNVNSDVNEAKSDKSNGLHKIEWAGKNMPVLHKIREDFVKKKPFKGLNIGACLHVTSETAVLMLTLLDGGARIRLCASNPLSTDDDVAYALASLGIEVFAREGESSDVYHNHIKSIMEIKPNIVLDDGADLVAVLSTANKKFSKSVLGSIEETTTGVIRLKNMEREGILTFPVIAVNQALTKHLFDNRYGTGQSTIEGLLRAAHFLIAGKNFVVAGYGWCGKGVAMRAKGLGAKVHVVEIDPVRALEAAMDGFSVVDMYEAAAKADIIVTVTGNIDVVRCEHIKQMKSGAILANSGHFDVEVDVKGIEEMCINKRDKRAYVTEYTMPDGKVVYVLGGGRLINLTAAEGHPPEVMDMSFANQALCCEYLSKSVPKECRVFNVPKEIDEQVARLKLKSMGLKLEKLTEKQQAYLLDWKLGT